MLLSILGSCGVCFTNSYVADVKLRKSKQKTWFSFMICFYLSEMILNHFFGRVTAVCVLDYWQFAIGLFCSVFVFTNTSTSQNCSLRRAWFALLTRHTCQNPQKKGLVLFTRPVRLNKKRELYTILKFCFLKKFTI